MKEAKISEVKNRLSQYLRFVRQGEVVRILDRDVPVAQLIPISTAVHGKGVGPEALADMERKGLVRRGTKPLDPEILEKDPPGTACGVLQTLIAERNAR